MSQKNVKLGILSTYLLRGGGDNVLDVLVLKEFFLYIKNV